MIALPVWAFMLCLAAQCPWSRCASNYIALVLTSPVHTSTVGGLWSMVAAHVLYGAPSAVEVRESVGASSPVQFNLVSYFRGSYSFFSPVSVPPSSHSQWRPPIMPLFLVSAFSRWWFRDSMSIRNTQQSSLLRFRSESPPSFIVVFQRPCPWILPAGQCVSLLFPIIHILPHQWSVWPQIWRLW